MSDINETIDQILKASKGLATKIKDEGNKQYQELVAIGEKVEESEESLVKQFRNFMEESFKDIKGSSNQVKLAGIGFATRVKGEGQSMFKELVELGTGKPASAKKAKPRAKAKTASAS